MHEEKQEEKYIRLSRTFFSKSMPDDFKRMFMLVIKNTHYLPDNQKEFLCDHIHHYENISDLARSELLDVLDGLQLFVLTPPQNNISA
jgi:hypothetical protein